jgi:hypothetical protein
MPARLDGNPTLIVGLIALFGNLLICGLPLFLGPVAWAMGNTYVKKCAEAGIQPESSGTAGRVMGIIATVLLGLALLSVVAFVVLMVIGAAASSR